MKTFKNLLQNFSTEFLDIAHKYSLVCLIDVYLNSGPIYVIIEITAKDDLNKANLVQTK